MKALLLALSCCLLAFSLHAQEKKNSKTGPVIEFKQAEIDYGSIEQNAEPFREFHFTNTGTAPLIISNAQGSCGCTVPTWPQEPILPGKSGVIKVRYDTNRIGPFEKTITLYTNDPSGPHDLKVRGEVRAE